jgi:fumarylacetoacetate (FAA) hydrolase family protein
MKHVEAVEQTLAALSSGCFVGRVWLKGVGPALVHIQNGRVVDITSRAIPTMRDLCEAENPAQAAVSAKGEDLGAVADFLLKPEDLLAPIDLQAVKAAGVTFATSMLERVIEEKARGDQSLAAGIRADISELIGDDLSKLVPGSPEAMALKAKLVARGAWSQYLEVGIGPDAEIFTKAQVLWVLVLRLAFIRYRRGTILSRKRC